MVYMSLPLIFPYHLTYMMKIPYQHKYVHISVTMTPITDIPQIFKLFTINTLKHLSTTT